jgi:RNA polymerase sigma-70 factor (ECF subfamily)
MAQLYDRYAALLLGLASRIVGDRVHAEDVLHDALLEACHHAGEYDPARGSVRAWLVTRVRSRALDEQQGSARRRRLLRNHPDRLTVAPFQAPDFRDGDNELLRRKLADLPVELGVVVNLVYYEGLTSAVAGSRLGIPNGTVKSRLARAMTLLRRHLATGTEGAA